MNWRIRHWHFADLYWSRLNSWNRDIALADTFDERQKQAYKPLANQIWEVVP